MPFKSEAQRKYLWAREPEIARDWTDTYGSRIQKENGGIMRLGFQNGNNVDDESTWKKIKKSKPFQALDRFAITPLMALANRYNALNPNSVNYNPLLQGQRDFAFEPIHTGGFGFQQDPIGRFLGSVDPNNPDYNPLYGQALVSMFGTNDLTEMLRKRKQKLISYDYQSKIKDKKLAKIEDMIKQAEARDVTAVQQTASLPSHYLERGGGGYRDAPIRSAAKAAAEGIDVKSTGHMGPGGKHYARGGIANIWLE